MKQSWALVPMLWALSAVAEPEVPVQAEVVYASTAAGTVEPALVKMQAAMATKVRYQTLKKVATQRVALVQNRPQSVALPNQKQAELTLQTLQANVATVKVRLAPTEAVYSLGRDKSLYIQGGAHDGGELWLVLSQPK